MGTPTETTHAVSNPDKDWTIGEIDELMETVDGLPPSQRRTRFRMYLLQTKKMVDTNGHPHVWIVAHQMCDSIRDKLTHDNEHRSQCPLVTGVVIAPDGSTKKLSEIVGSGAVPLGSMFTWKGLKQGFTVNGPAAFAFSLVVAVGIIICGFVYVQNRETRQQVARVGIERLAGKE